MAAFCMVPGGLNNEPYKSLYLQIYVQLNALIKHSTISVFKMILARSISVLVIAKF